MMGESIREQITQWLVEQLGTIGGVNVERRTFNFDDLSERQCPMLAVEGGPDKHKEYLGGDRVSRTMSLQIIGYVKDNQNPDKALNDLLKLTEDKLEEIKVPGGHVNQIRWDFTDKEPSLYAPYGKMVLEIEIDFCHKKYDQ